MIWIYSRSSVPDWNQKKLELVEHIPAFHGALRVLLMDSTLERFARFSIRKIALFKHAQ